MTRSRGLTIAELLIAIAIILMIAAIAYPVIRSAKARAKESSCIANLRNVQLAIAMYRSDHLTEGVYGDAESMGLPRGFKPLIQSYGLLLPSLRCSGTSWMGAGSPAVYHMMWRFRDDPNVRDWTAYASQYKDSAISVADLNHSLEGPVFSPYVTKRGLGVYLDGHIETRLRKGDPFDPNWWHD